MDNFILLSFVLSVLKNMKNKKMTCQRHQFDLLFSLTKWFIPRQNEPHSHIVNNRLLRTMDFSLMIVDKYADLC